MCSLPQKISFLNFHYYVPELPGFQKRLILYLLGMAFHARVVSGLFFYFLFKSTWTHCVRGALLTTYNYQNSLKITTWYTHFVVTPFIFRSKYIGRVDDIREARMPTWLHAWTCFFSKFSLLQLRFFS